jgi:dipeptidyl aminopeptidase/acylaminoacyl peptidase
MRQTFKVSLAFLVTVISIQAQSTTRPIALDDFAKIRTVGDPQVSPDGKWVAYTLGTVDTEKDNVIEAKTGAQPRQLTTYNGNDADNRPGVLTAGGSHISRAMRTNTPHNVPVAGGEQMYQALRSLGIDTQLVIYPGQYHTL